jgi:hypothetical protein
MNGPKRHHYVPQFLLEEFAENNLFYVYDRKLNKYTKQSPINTTCIKYYYKMEGDYDFDKNIVEKLFSYIESKAKPVIEKLKFQKALTDQDRYNLTLFISFLKMRVPFSEKLTYELEDKLAKEYLKFCFSSKDFFMKKKQSIELKTGEKINFDPKDILNKLDNFKIHTGKDSNLGMRLMASLKMAEYLFCMDWIFLFAHKDSSFILSDNPFIIIPPKDHNSIYGVGLLTKNAIKVIPLTSNICLMICNYNPENPSTNKKVDYPRKEIRKLNCNFAINSERYIISKERSILERIVKITEIDKWQIEKRIEVS